MATVNFTLPSPYESEMADIARRQKMAEIMQQQAFQPAETFSYNGIQAMTSPLTGLAKALQGYMAVKMQKDLANEQKGLGEKYRKQSVEEGSQFLKALRGTPAIEGTEGVPEQKFVPTNIDIEDNPRLLSNVNPQQQAAMNMGQMPELTVPAQRGVPAQPAVGPDLARALQLSMGSVNPMVQSAGGALLATMTKPKEVKWEKAELPQPDGSVKTGWVDVNSPNPATTFVSGGNKAPELVRQDTGKEIITLNKTTGQRVNNVPSIPKDVDVNTAATLSQTQANVDRAYNGLSVFQKADLADRAKARGISERQLFLNEYQAQNPTPQVVQSEGGYATVQPRSGVSAPVMTAQGTQLPGAPKQAPEAYSKNATALLNMTDGLNTYQKELKGFTVTTALLPDERARIGNAYENVLLQAKEIYNLGVLNGPDEAILKRIITNPLDIKSAPISTEAMIKQVEAMRKIIERQNANLATVYKQPKIELPSIQPAAAGTQTIYATNGKQRIMSTDGGQTWKPVEGAQ
jgi:hypothetical protein